MPKILNLADLIKAKETHNFHWIINDVLPPKKVVGKECRAYFYLPCGLCNKTYWVEWSSLKRGKSKSCSKCFLKSTVPTLEEMNKIVAKYNMLWKPSLLYKTDASTNRRKYWMKCQCGKFEWVRWNHFQQGLTTACKSCAARKIRNGLNDKYYSKSNLRKMWYRINRNVRKSNIKNHWEKYEDFLKWSLNSGYLEGASLLRKDKHGDFNPTNCFWDLSKAKKTGVNLVNTLKSFYRAE